MAVIENVQRANLNPIETARAYAKLQDELSDTENKIQAARRFYNTNVRDINIKVETFPTNLIARTLGFVKMEFFGDLSETEKQPVQVKF